MLEVLRYVLLGDRDSLRQLARRGGAAQQLFTKGLMYCPGPLHGMLDCQPLARSRARLGACAARSLWQPELRKVATQISA